MSTTGTVLRRKGQTGLDGFKRLSQFEKSAPSAGKFAATSKGPQTIEDVSVETETRKEIARHIIPQPGGYNVIIHQMQEYDGSGNEKRMLYMLTQWKMNDEKGHLTRRNKFNLPHKVAQPLFRILANGYGYEV